MIMVRLLYSSSMRKCVLSKDCHKIRCVDSYDFSMVTSFPSAAGLIIILGSH